MKSKKMMKWKKEIKRIMRARPTEWLVSYLQTCPTGDTCWLLIDYCCCWLLLTDYCCCCRLFSPSAKSTVPIVLLLTDTNMRLHQKSILFGDQNFSNPSQKGTLLQKIIWSKSPSLYVMIEKYRSCLVIIMHLKGKYFGVLLIMLEFLATLVMAAYYWDFPLTSIHCFWPCVGPLFVFFIFFCYEWVFAGICFWYFPLPAGALDLRPWPFCRPGRKLTGPGTDPGTMQTTRNSALLYCFCPYSFFILLYFRFCIFMFWPWHRSQHTSNHLEYCPLIIIMNFDVLFLSFFWQHWSQSLIILSKPFLLCLFLWCISVILCL